MIGSVQHKIAKCLAVIFQSVSDLLSTYCISNFFKFSNFIRNSEICSENKLLLSLYILIVHKCALQNTLQICANALYRGHLGPALVPEALFLEFII